MATSDENVTNRNVTNFNTYRCISPFDISKDWGMYVEQVDLYFAANCMTDDTRKRDIFLTCCGSELYGVIKNLLRPQLPRCTNYTQIIQKITTHLIPKPSKYVSIVTFRNTFRNIKESVSEFANGLRSLTENCMFDGNRSEEELLQFIIGV